MIIKGIQQTSLIDYPGHIATVLFTAGCNMRCPYCHNSELVLNSKKLPEIEEDDILEFLTQRKNLIDGVCITGGEPTIHKDLPEFIKRIRSLGLKIKLDSNGTNPDVLQALLDEELLDYIAMDVKQTKSKYHTATGVKNPIGNIQKSIDIIRNSGIDYEFRTTILPEIHSKEDVLSIGQWLKGCKHYTIQKFIPTDKMFNKSLSEKFTKTDYLELKEKLTVCADIVEIK